MASSAGRRVSGEEPEYELQSNPRLESQTASRNSRQPKILSEVEEQKVQPQAALPQNTQHTTLGQDNPEDEEEDIKSSEEDDDDDSSEGYTTTDKGKEVAYDIIDPAAHDISREYKTSRQGSVVQPSPINPTTHTIQVLEEALEAITVYAKSQEQEQETVINSNDNLQTILDKSA